MSIQNVDLSKITKMHTHFYLNMFLSTAVFRQLAYDQTLIAMIVTISYFNTTPTERVIVSM